MMANMAAATSATSKLLAYAGSRISKQVETVMPRVSSPQKKGKQLMHLVEASVLIES